MRIAFVHDWLTVYAGAERVLEQMLSCYPDADLFSLVDFLPQGERGFILDKPVTTSFLQKMPLARKHYRHYLSLMPCAIEQFDMSAYDVVISSSHAVAKGILTGPDQLHICMCYSPIRYAWDMQHQYLRESGQDKGLRGIMARWLLHKIRLWDTRTANGVDEFIAISNFIARRIWKTYRREATIIYPPVNTSQFQPGTVKEDFYLTASRMVPYKRIDLIVQSFNKLPDKQLIVIGDGPDFARIRNLAGLNIQILGKQPHATLLEHLQRAKAFIFAAEEDFGIAPLEAQACGTPVIAYAKGGALETIQGQEAEKPTGMFFHKQSTDAIIEAVKAFERNPDIYTAGACRENAQRFSQERFRQEFSSFVSLCISRQHRHA